MTHKDKPDGHVFIILNGKPVLGYFKAKNDKKPSNVKRD